MKFFTPWNRSSKVEPIEPIFGRYVKLIHPYDFYDLISPHMALLDCEVGTTGIPIPTDDGRYYLSRSPIMRFKDELYVVTTTVKPSPEASIR